MSNTWKLIIFGFIRFFVLDQFRQQTPYIQNPQFYRLK